MIMVLVTAGLFAAPPTAKVELVASVGEVPANSGIRLVEGNGLPGGVDPVTFDPLFFSAPSEIQMATGVDTALTTASGYFTVLVRRPTVSGFTVSVSATPLKLTGQEKYLAYTITGTGFSIALPAIAGPNGAASYSGTASALSILRHEKPLRYIIPRDATATQGVYTADITMTLTTT